MRHESFAKSRNLRDTLCSFLTNRASDRIDDQYEPSDQRYREKNDKRNCFVEHMHLASTPREHVRVLLMLTSNAHHRDVIEADAAVAKRRDIRQARFDELLRR